MIIFWIFLSFEFERIVLMYIDGVLCFNYVKMVGYLDYISVRFVVKDNYYFFFGCFKF